MSQNDHFSPDELYRRGLEYFNAAEWQAAIDTLTVLQASGIADPGVDELVADARVKLQFESALQPAALPPPPRSRLVPLMVTIALGLLMVLGIVFWVRRLPPTVASIPLPSPTATQRPLPPPAATQQPLPPTPVAQPTRVRVPTPTQILTPGTVVIAADASAQFSTPKHIELIYDASGSMLGPVPGTDQLRWEAARAAVRTVLDSGTIPLDSSIEVRTFGQRRDNGCEDLEVVLPREPYSYERVLNAIDAIRPAVRGMTPLSASLEAAADDLASVDESTTLILVTDGVDISCDGDPVAAAASFVEQAAPRKVHVIGFALDDPTASGMLRDIAAAGNGLYFDAKDSAELAAALQQAIVLRYHIMAPSGLEVASGTVGDQPLALDPGTYRLTIDANPTIEREIVVTDGGVVQVQLRADDAGRLTADVLVP